ncbi:MAG: aldehyde dehydrogenase family protein [Actinomycetota bacterium]|nr:aldehyde dehydrogenase family protein [Actinomycetota bacterium]
MTGPVQPDAPVQLEALGHNGSYHARNRLTVPDVTGTPVAELSLVPWLFVQRSMAALRRADTVPADRRAAALTLAGRAFATATINGLSAENYQYVVSRVSGLPISVVRTAAELIMYAAAEAYSTAQCARPAAAVNRWRDPTTRTGRAVWTRRGDVFAVHAAGNHPGVHALWLEALALGYRVAVRPSQREPFTPHRLISALREAGFGADHVVLLPTDHAVAGDIIQAADLAMVYGGEDVVTKYAGTTTALAQGPGRSKILLTGQDWRSHLDTVVTSIGNEGGTACVNTTAVFVEGDPAPVAEAIAERLSTIPSLPPEDDKAVLPVQPLAAAAAVEKFLLSRAQGTTAWLGGDGIVDNLGDGSAVLRPAVFQVGSASAPQTSIELGFPCVWVAPWANADGVQPLRNTLVLTVITQDEQLVERLVNEPTISNVYVGDHPTYWMRPGVPHDGYLAEFLMRTKAVIRD